MAQWTTTVGSLKLIPNQAERVALFAILTDSVRAGTESARDAMLCAVAASNLDMVTAMVQARKHDPQQTDGMGGEPLIHWTESAQLQEYLRYNGFAVCELEVCRRRVVPEAPEQKVAHV